MKKGSRAEPFFLRKDSQQAILFLHGFTASPSEVYPTARKLHENYDCDIHGILLPGHGSKPADLNKTGWPDWYGAAEVEARKLLDAYEDVYVAGLSMGGLLAYHAGVTLPGIKGVVAINAPIFTHYPILSALAPIMKTFVPYFTKGHRRQRRLDLVGRFEYNCYPVRAYTSLIELRKIILAEMDQLKTPLLIIQSLQDQAVNPKSAEYILEKSAHCSPRLITLPNSGHIATMEGELDIICSEMIQFMDHSKR